jgi:uncharacterized protein YbjQ (UPF0145 family)
MIISTTDTVPGKKVVKTIGVVEARRSHFVLNKAKSAQKNLEKEAEKIGANAIIGFRIAKVSGVAHAYGTAVIVE